VFVAFLVVAQTGADNPEALEKDPNKNYLDGKIQNQSAKQLNHNAFEQVLQNSPTKVGLRTYPPKRPASHLWKEAKQITQDCPKVRYHIDARESPCAAPAEKNSCCA